MASPAKGKKPEQQFILLPKPTKLWIKGMIDPATAGGSDVHVLDACVSEYGLALSTILDYGVRTWAIQPRIEEMAETKKHIYNTIQCSPFDAKVTPEACMSMIYLNPPYRLTVGASDGAMKYLHHCTKWLVPHGVLTFVVPDHVLIPLKNRQWLAQNFTDIKVFSVDDGSYGKVKPVVLLAKKAAQDAHGARVFDKPPYSSIWERHSLRGQYELPFTEGPRVFDAKHAITDEDIAAHRSRLLDGITKIASSFDTVRTIQPLFNPRKAHMAALILAGALDGRLQGDDGEILYIKGYSSRRKTETFDEERNVTIVDDRYHLVIRTIRVTPEGGEWRDIE